MRGNVVMKGYYNDPEATATAMRGGWFHTGDAAVVHPDGYVEIRDRLKDVIISGGENISSVEVEGVLLRHPAVQEAAVVGMPDEKWGEAPHAFVVLKPDGASAPTGELRTFARERLAHFKAPHSVHVRHGAAEDGDRQDPEVRAERQPPGDRGAVTKAAAASDWATEPGPSVTDGACIFSIGGGPSLGPQGDDRIDTRGPQRRHEGCRKSRTEKQRCRGRRSSWDRTRRRRSEGTPGAA